MNKLAVQRQSRPLLPELSELFNGFPTFAGLPSIAGLRPLFDHNLIRVKTRSDRGHRSHRARRAVDDQSRAGPDRRNERAPEFSYGTFARTIVLPVGADEDDINAEAPRAELTDGRDQDRSDD